MVVGQFAEEAECLVIGAGPAGRAAARRAVQLGLATLIIDGHEAPAIEGATFVQGTACFDDPRQVVVDGGARGRFRFKKAIVAAGYRPAAAPPGWPESDAIVTWPARCEPDQGSGAVLVVGAGRGAVEAATAYAGAGWRVMLAAGTPALLPDADDALAEIARAGLERAGCTVRPEAPVARVQAAGGAVEAQVGDERSMFDRLVRTDVRPASDGLGLDKARVECADDGAVVIDDRCATSNPRVLAAGGVTGPEVDPGRARAQGRVAAEVAAGRDSALDARVWPRVVRAAPALAWCGLTDNDALAHGIECTVLEARRGAPGDASFRFARLLVDPDGGTVLGAALAGAGAPEAIALAVLAIEMGAVTDDLAALVQPGGSLGELLTEAATCAP